MGGRAGAGGGLGTGPAGAHVDPVAVTFVSSHAGLGGSERYLELLIESLGPEWRRSVVTLDDGPLRARLEARGVPVELAATGRRLGLLRGAVRLRRALRRDRPSVVHANGVKAALVAVLSLPSAPVIWVKHDLSWDGRLGRLIARRCTLVVGVSEVVLGTFRGMRGIRARVVPNGIPDAAFDAEPATAALARIVAGDGPVVALVGRIHPAKGQMELLEAAPLVRAGHPHARFLLVGGEDPHQAGYAAAVRARVSELGLDAEMAFSPHREDVLGLVAACDVLVVPSGPDERGMGREGFGLAGVEAMAVGTPVVGYADGALPEVLGDCALLVAPGDRAGLAEGIGRLLDEDALRERLTACGRRRAESRYRLSATVEEMRRAYRDALAG